MKELKEIQKTQHSKTDPIFTVELLSESIKRRSVLLLSNRSNCLSVPFLFPDDNLFEWHCKIFRIDPDSPLALDLVELNIPHISLHISFPQTFPFSPPFVRVVEPKIEKGFVMEGNDSQNFFHHISKNLWDTLHLFVIKVERFASNC
jgi:ubiquitin-conjugating enzyme E2 Q